MSAPVVSEQKLSPELSTLEKDYNEYVESTDCSVFKTLELQKTLFLMQKVILKLFNKSIYIDVEASLMKKPITTFSERASFSRYVNDENCHLHTIERLIKSVPLIPYINAVYPFSNSSDFNDVKIFNGEPYVNILNSFLSFLEIEKENMKERKNVIKGVPLENTQLIDAINETTVFLCTYFYLCEGEKRLILSLTQTNAVLADVFRKFEMNMTIEAKFYSISKLEVFERLILLLTFLTRGRYDCIIGISNTNILKGSLGMIKDMKTRVEKNYLTYYQ